MKKYIWHILVLGIFSISGIIVGYTIFNGFNFKPDLARANTEVVDLSGNKNIFRSISAEYSDFSRKLFRNSDTVTIGFVGDIIPSINAPQNIFDGVISYTKKPDIMIGNFEGVIATNQYEKCRPEFNKCFSFNGDKGFLKLLKEASFDVLNISNNHFNDYGLEGMEETIKKIQEYGMRPVGEKDKITYIDKSNLRIGIVSFSTSWWAEDLNNEGRVKRVIQEAKNNSNIVVAVFHAGGEGANYSRTPKETEWYLGENRGDVRLFARRAIDAGADVVFGSGPHVLRGMEKYKGKLIAYSLGNFASASDKLLNVGLQQMSAMIEVALDKNGSFVSGSLYPLQLNSSIHPQYDENGKAISFMNNLSKIDFGKDAVLIDDSGEIIFE